MVQVPLQTVTPCAGVWIETKQKKDYARTLYVTPCAGVWIETKKELEVAIASGSLLVQECGLKQGYQKDQLILLTSSLYEGVDCNDLYIQKR